MTTNITMYTVDALQYCMYIKMSYKITASNQSGHNTVIQYIHTHTYAMHIYVATAVPYRAKIVVGKILNSKIINH